MFVSGDLCSDQFGFPLRRFDEFFGAQLGGLLPRCCFLRSNLAQLVGFAVCGRKLVRNLGLGSCPHLFDSCVRPLKQLIRLQVGGVNNLPRLFLSGPQELLHSGAQARVGRFGYFCEFRL